MSERRGGVLAEVVAALVLASGAAAVAAPVLAAAQRVARRSTAQADAAVRLLGALEAHGVTACPPTAGAGDGVRWTLVQPGAMPVLELTTAAGAESLRVRRRIVCAATAP